MPKTTEEKMPKLNMSHLMRAAVMQESEVRERRYLVHCEAVARIAAACRSEADFYERMGLYMVVVNAVDR